jgi:ribosomal protein L7/L12
MGEFKKGDEVRLIKSEDYNGNGRYGKTGEIGTVIRYDAIDHAYYVDFIESGQWWAKASNLEPSAATLKIEAGKFYKTRDGRKVGPAFISGNIATFGSTGNYASAVWADDGRSSSRDDKLSLKDNDIIAEWIDEPVAKASNDNAEPKFNIGDRVRVVKDGFISGGSGHSAKIGDEFVLREMNPTKIFWRTDGPDFYEHEIELVFAAIVALIENGQPKPSSTPHVHTSAEAAEKEAKRLSAKYKGKKFGVFTLTATHEEAAPVYDHKWQNMAALGLKIDAIKELRAVAGLTLKGAKDAVEAWIEYENAA